MKASERLADAESTASADHRRAQRDPHAFRSPIYPAGSEFSLCHAQSQLMSAVVGVLNESLTESIRGFYKLRKAYMTLDGILEAETRYVQSRGGAAPSTFRRRSIDSLRSNRSARSLKGMPGGFETKAKSPTTTQSSHRAVLELKANHIAEQDQISESAKSLPTDNEDNDDDDDEFYDANEAIDGKSASYTGQIEIVSTINKPLDTLIDHGEIDNTQNLPHPRTLPLREGMLDLDPDSDIFSNPIDVFIHSGANLYFGLLLVMISMIPPAFGKLLSIIGFRGDRDRGLRMLWQASKFHNTNGAMAGLVLLGYYNSVVGFSDILPDPQPHVKEDDVVEGYPKERCVALLIDMRERHPRSHLWRLEEARMQAINHCLSTAVSLLENSPKSSLKQVEALDMFEKSLDSMFMHDYNKCATSFIACVSLNNWSHALYYYIAGAAHVELYRHYKSSSSKAAGIHAKKAVELLKIAPKHAGKKKFLARQLPFDLFVTRKINKWEHRAHEWNVDLIDAVGVSPIEEMIFLWGGYKRMDKSQLEFSLARLSWSESPISNPTWSREPADEHAILGLLRGVVLRNLGQWNEATNALRTEVLSIDKAELKGGYRDDWTAPAAHHEMGVICWMRKTDVTSEQRSEAGSKRGEADWVGECEEWVEKAARWEGYELDARIGLKVATAQDTLKKWKQKRTGS